MGHLKEYRGARESSHFHFCITMEGWGWGLGGDEAKTTSVMMSISEMGVLRRMGQA